MGVNAENAVRIALSLHKFSCNGFDINFDDYRISEEVISNVMEVVE
ncbi:hypothetical protein [Sulfuracidifex tepidarius]|uniref:Uncharacterized protein n=1 Tax=Sulfuracidifex tepidarius TaxID=1294262 RepID=A0A510E0G0_9CREN|nr:hypothetical protein [Sulfuracidifex tepidarius]BBG25927.1 hypothetical protein IC007_0432 [Sulfuracidifex tepidarius]